MGGYHVNVRHGNMYQLKYNFLKIIIIIIIIIKKSYNAYICNIWTYIFDSCAHRGTHFGVFGGIRAYILSTHLLYLINLPGYD